MIYSRFLNHELLESLGVGDEGSEGLQKFYILYWCHGQQSYRKGVQGLGLELRD